MYDDLYPEAAQTALDAKAARPPEPKQTPRFSLWGTTAAVPKGVAAGAAQATGSAADVLGAFGSVLAATDAHPGGMFSTNTPTKLSGLIIGTEEDRARQKLLSNGPDYMSEGGRSFRNVAKDYTPDPLTTHAAERIVFDFSRVASKAVTAAITMGGIPGAIVTGLEEGFTVSDQLAQEGVDLDTRSAVGAVTAVTNALSFGLPVAGKTAVQTGVLALTGGPLSFMAQNAATRKILQDADYSKLADQYDPFDPLGLALSTVIPLGFGALAMRGVKAKGPMPDGSPPPDVPPLKAPDDLVDAARVTLLRENMDATNPKPGDLEAADAHNKAYKQAMEQQAAGERVSVADIAPKIDDAQPAKVDAVTNQNDVVGNQGGRSADDILPGALAPVDRVKKAARDVYDTFKKRTGADGDAARFEVEDNSTPVPFRAGAAEQELENLGWDIGDRMAAYASNDASHYITARKLVASDAEYGDEYVTAKIRISNHGNTTKAHDHPDVNIAPGEDIVWDIEEKLNQKITDEGYELPVSAPSDKRAAGQKIRESDATETTATPEAVDAARTSLLRESVDNSNPLPKDLAAAQPHADAHAKAIDQMASGERVNVADVLPENVAVKATEDMAARIEEFTTAARDSGLMPAARGEVALLDFPPLSSADSLPPGTWVQLPYPDMRGRPVAQIREVGVNDLYLPELDASGKLQPEKRSYLDPYTQRALDGEKPPAITVVEMEDGRLRVVDGHRRVMAARAAGASDIRAVVSPLIETADGKVPLTFEIAPPGTFAPRSGSLTDPLPAKPIAGAKEAAPKQAGAPDYAQNIDLIEAQRIRAVADKMRAKNPGVAAKYDDMALAHELKAERDTRMAEGQGEKASYHEKEATRLALENPDVMVMVEGMDAPKPLSEVMAMIKKDLADDIEDSNLIQVAAECFISTGAGGT